MKFKGFSDESIKPPATSNKTLKTSVDHVGTKSRVRFIGDGLKQEKITFSHGKKIIIYIVYEIQRSVNISCYPTLGFFFFFFFSGAVKLAKHNNDFDLCKHSG